MVMNEKIDFTNNKRYDFEYVKDVYAFTHHLLWTKYKKRTIAIIIFFILSIVTSFYNGEELIFLPAVYLLFGFYAYVFSVTYKVFVKQFAERLGFTYVKTAYMKSAWWDSREIQNVMSGVCKEIPVRIYNYTHRGNWRNNTGMILTVFELSIKKTTFPYILLRSKSMQGITFIDKKGDQGVEISLEGRYQKYFKLFVKEGYEIEALQIFTPEILEMLIHDEKAYSIEFAGNKIYIYDDKKIISEKCFNNLMGISEQLVILCAPLLNRLHDDFASLHAYYSKE